jgi:hypothetical protein
MANAAKVGGTNRAAAASSIAFSSVNCALLKDLDAFNPAIVKHFDR